MRPQILFSLFAPVTSLTGVGPRIAKLIENVAGPKIVDLLWHLPREIVDRSFGPTIGDAPNGRVCTLTVKVEKHEKGYARKPYRVRCRDDSGFLTLIFFHAKEDYLLRLLPIGETRIVSGTIEEFSGEKQITHPDYVLKLDDKETIPVIEPVYPLTAGLTLKTIGKAIRGSLAKAPELKEWLDKPLKLVG